MCSPQRDEYFSPGTSRLAPRSSPIQTPRISLHRNACHTPHVQQCAPTHSVQTAAQPSPPRSDWVRKRGWVQYRSRLRSATACSILQTGTRRRLELTPPSRGNERESCHRSRWRSLPGRKSLRCGLAEEFTSLSSEAVSAGGNSRRAYPYPDLGSSAQLQEKRKTRGERSACVQKWFRAERKLR